MNRSIVPDEIAEAVGDALAEERARQRAELAKTVEPLHEQIIELTAKVEALTALLSGRGPTLELP
jgi:hypothetical protein